MLQNNYYYNKSDSLHKAYIDSSDTINDLIILLKVVLNKTHSTNHSLRYWKILLLPWLRLLVENYHHIVLTSEFDTDNPQQRSDQLVSLDYDDFIELIVEEDYRSRLRNRLDTLEEVSLKTIEYTVKGAAIGIIRQSKSLKDWLSYAVAFLTRASSFLLYKRINLSLDYFDSKLYLLLLKRGVCPVLFRLDDDHRDTVHVDGELRDSLFYTGLECGCDQGQRRLWKLICATIPLSYLENYKDLLIGSRGSEYVPDVVMTKNIHSNDKYKQWIASAVEKGSKLIVAQHGGGFGIVYYDYSEQMELHNSDLYLSYFSSSQVGIKQIPANKYISYDSCNVSERVLLVNIVYPSFYKYHSGPIGNQFHQNINDQIDFIDALDQSVRDTLSVRQYQKSYDMPVKEKYQQSGFDVYVENNLDFYPLIKDSRLVVLSYMGTTWLETLMNNIPTVVFVNPECWEFRDSVQPFMDQLREIGILHDTPQSAALHINNTVNHIENWWSGNDLQTIRMKFCQNYAYTDKYWRDVWAETITDAIKQEFVST
jgi:putative transferase (TIGR04331 family)